MFAIETETSWALISRFSAAVAVGAGDVDHRAKHGSACSTKLAISAIVDRSSPCHTPRRSANAATASSTRPNVVLAAARLRAVAPSP
jgi:hypothetical protein